MNVPDSSLQFVSKVSEYKPGMPQLVECFGTYCGPCRQMVPHLAALTKKYPEVHIVSVSMEDFGTVTNFSLQNPTARQYNLAVDSQGRVGSLMQQYGVNGIPHAFLLNGAGQVVWHGHPAQCEPELMKIKSQVPPPKKQEDTNTRTTVNFGALFKK